MAIDLAIASRFEGLPYSMRRVLGQAVKGSDTSASGVRRAERHTGLSFAKFYWSRCIAISRPKAYLLTLDSTFPMILTMLNSSSCGCFLSTSPLPAYRERAILATFLEKLERATTWSQ